MVFDFDSKNGVLKGETSALPIGYGRMASYTFRTLF